jgi:hypothetical protein
MSRVKHYIFCAGRAALALALISSAGCAGQPESGAAEQTEALNAHVDGRLVVDWNALAFEVAQQTDGVPDPFLHLRAMTMMHLAIHDAVNGVRSKYAHYAADLDDRRADVSVAAAAAAHGVLSVVYPKQQALLDARLQASSAGKHHHAKQRGVTIGKAAAQAILAARASDGSDATLAYTPGTDPGRYRYVPPFDFIYRPAWRHLTPFALAAPEQFRSAPPPPLASAEYAADYAEVRRYGRATGSTRTPEQTAYADWWYELSEIGWNRIARETWQKQPKRDLWFTARLFALLNVALLDAYVAGWDSKLHYDHWRPYSAIREGDTDQNPATEAERDWEPYCVTPPIQDYPSTHSALGAAGAVVLRRLYERDVPFAMESTSSKPPGETRHFTSFDGAAAENADSRVACGIHFRFATRAGLALGQHVGDHAVDTRLLPRHPHRK